MKDTKSLLRHYFTDYFHWLIELFLVFGGALLIGILLPEPKIDFIWVVPIGLIIVLLTNLGPAILLAKAAADLRGQRISRQRIFIESVQLDPHLNIRARTGFYSSILGTAKYQLIDESGNIYRLRAAKKRDLLIHSSPEIEADVEYLERSRLILSIRLIPGSGKRLPNNPAALLEFTRFFADYIRQ